MTYEVLVELIEGSGKHTEDLMQYLLRSVDAFEEYKNDYKKYRTAKELALLEKFVEYQNKQIMIEIEKTELQIEEWEIQKEKLAKTRKPVKVINFPADKA